MRICEICVTKKKGGDYEETKDHRAGGEGDSSRAHGIPDGTGNNQLHGSRPVLIRAEGHSVIAPDSDCMSQGR